MAVKPHCGSRLSLVRIPLGWRLPPERAALLLRDDPYPFALIGRWAGGGAIIGSAPVRLAAGDEDPFTLLDEQPLVEVAGHRATATPATPVGGGWFGWLGYPLGRRLELIDAGPPGTAGHPPFHLAFYDHVLHLDPAGEWWFEALSSPERSAVHETRLDEFHARVSDPPRPAPFSTAPWQSTPTPAGHALAVAACRERIRAGDLFQANICARLESRLSGEAIDLFASAVAHLRPDRAAFFSTPRGAVASLSPELFLERHGRRVRSAPIKGTRAKPEDHVRAREAREGLLRSRKDRAENIMIVDLVRNDLGRVCVPGTIRVDTLAAARAHAGVWHLVSEVSGEMRKDVGDGELVRAAFPPGSVSGAPKIAAMNVVAELESTPRELYTGALGFASPVSGLELSVAIRTFEVEDQRVWLGVGGGIVADSDPAAEAAECLVKAAPLLEAIGATIASPRSTGGLAVRPPLPCRLGPRPTPRPEPGAGVFETLLVQDGQPVELEPHLRRLETSLAALYAAPLPMNLEADLVAAARRLESGRLRVDVFPVGRGLEFEIASAPLPRRPSPVRLCPVTLPGGLGGHKWADRRLLAALANRLEGEPLLCDLDGIVLEAGRANVFVVEPGPSLLTPAADGRILPGVSRARVIQLAHDLGLEVREERVGLVSLARADELFVTGSVAGVEAAVLNGLEPIGPAPVTARLAEAWRAWVGATSSTRVPLPGPTPLPA